MVYVFLADGFEEIEAVAPIDILRRLNIQVTTIGVTGKTVKGSHNILFTADKTIDETDFLDLEALVLPGGMPGTTNLFENKKLCSLIKESASKKKLLAALCAAPSVLGRLGLLTGREFTCYPGFEDYANGGIYKNVPLVKSMGEYNVITAFGPGAAFRFGFALAEEITKNTNAVQKLKESMLMCGDE